MRNPLYEFTIEDHCELTIENHKGFRLRLSSITLNLTPRHQFYEYLWFHEEGEGGVSVHPSGVIKEFKADDKNLIFSGDYRCLFDASDINHKRFAGTFVYSKVSFNLDRTCSSSDATTFSYSHPEIGSATFFSIYVLGVGNRRDFAALKSWVDDGCNLGDGDWVSPKAKGRAPSLILEVSKEEIDPWGVICDADSEVNRPHRVIVVGLDGRIVTSEEITLSPGDRLDHPKIAFCLAQKYPPLKMQNVRLARIKEGNSCWLNFYCVQFVSLCSKSSENHFKASPLCQLVQYKSHSKELISAQNFGVSYASPEEGVEQVRERLESISVSGECIKFLVSAFQEDMARS